MTESTPKRVPQHVPMSQFVVDASGELIVGGQRLSVLAERVGQTPFYAHDRGLLKSRVAELRAALPREIKLHYAMKANPMPAKVAGSINAPGWGARRRWSRRGGARGRSRCAARAPAPRPWR